MTRFWRRVVVDNGLFRPRVSPTGTASLACYCSSCWGSLQAVGRCPGASSGVFGDSFLDFGRAGYVGVRAPLVPEWELPLVCLNLNLIRQRADTHDQ